MEDLLKKYGSKELARMTYRNLQDRKKQRKRDVDCFIADRIRVSYSRRNDSKRKLGQW
ncbi:MAG: hypothetical protein ACRCVJ_12325 [Clostridium sp.]|uniref:hypothetical protein n=1 Tax=Clostridium sp. TaxID=1506 RepID=UPI003F391562